jgi:carbonic anhydrase
MYFKSEYGRKVIKGPEEYEVKEFHLHHKSEHTIEGVHYDLEMHIVHLPTKTATKPQTKNALASAMGVIFDTKKHDKVSP